MNVPPVINSRVAKLLWIGGLSLAGVAALVLFCFDPTRVPIYPECTFHRLTGLDCPGCGSLRALHALSHGHLLEALRFNTLTVLSVPLLAWFGFRLARHEFAGGRPVAVKPVWLWAYLAAWITFGIARELPVPFFAWFAP